MANTLQNKLAVITGGTRGIGQAITEHLLEAGATIIYTGTKPNIDVAEGCTYYCADFSDSQAISEFSKFLADKKPDILINNAGTTAIAPFSDINIDDYEKIQRVNTYAPFRFCQAVLPGMKEKGWGRIVNISSIFGKLARSQRASYCTSKFALDGMTAALAAEVAEFNILANCVAPGYIETDLTRNVLGEKGMEELIPKIPMKRLGTPEEIAKFVTWLAGPENTYISGQNIAIDGGYTRV